MIQIGLTAFRWGRHEGGYQWWAEPAAEVIRKQRAAQRSGRRYWLAPTRLVPKVPDARLMLYEPLREAPQLYREFASLDRDESAFLAFADKYGPLSEHLEWSGETPKGLLPGSSPSNRLKSWEAEHAALSDAVADVDAVRKGSVSVKPSKTAEKHVRKVSQLLPWENLLAGRGGLRSMSDAARNSLMKVLPDGVPDLQKSSLNAVAQVMPLVSWLDSLVAINERLSGHNGRSGVHAQLVFHSERSLSEPAFSLHLVPSDLLGAMWLQLARDLAERPEFKECPRCHQWFEVSTEGMGKRRHAKFCSSKCQVADWKENNPNGAKVKSRHGGRKPPRPRARKHT